MSAHCEYPDRLGYHFDQNLLNVLFFSFITRISNKIDEGKIEAKVTKSLLVSLL